MSEHSFKIAVSDESLALLRKKLSLVTLPDELNEAGWDYGVPLADMRRLVAYWKDGYDWRKHEARLNADLAQFTRDIHVRDHGMLKVHYIHQRSVVQDAIPLLFVHGWPGCFLEVWKLLPLLVESFKLYPAFHVVALSLPGYGFSEAPKKKGFGEQQMAEVGHKMMLALGYDEYVTQGGDWGYGITKTMAQMYGPKHAKAWHTNTALAPAPRPLKSPFLFIYYLLFGYTEEEKAGLEQTKRFQEKGEGYYHIQSTQPQTLGYSLADSPVGLLAWIYEKLVNWTDCYPWTDDEVLTWISIYWFSAAGPTASLRLYYEYEANRRESPDEKWGANIPLGISYFPRDLEYVLPKRWVRKLPNLVFESEHPSGGHFAAYEQPQGLTDDLRKMFGKGGPAFGVVRGKTGYPRAE